MTDTSSCRPGRLVRYNETIDAVCDGLARRVGTLDDALAAYRGSCSPEYRALTYAADDTLRDFLAGLREHGTWTGDVGRAFIAADAVEAYMDPSHGFDPEGVRSRDDAELFDRLAEEHDDPYLGIPEGMAGAIADGLNESDSQDGPPAWIEALKNTGDAAEVAGIIMEQSALVLAGLPSTLQVTFRYTRETIEIWSDGVVIHRYTQAELQARLRLPTASAPRIASAAKWVGRIGAVVQLGAGAYSQWEHDAGMDTAPRIGRAVTRGGVPVLTGFLGGAAAGAVCGPGAPVCSTVLGIAGAIGGAFLGDEIVDILPWMQDDEPLPGENDLDAIEDTLAGSDLDPVLAANVDLMASDMALEATADDPVFQAEVRSLLPDRGLLEDTINPPPPPEMAPPTGTTVPPTTTTTVPSPPEPSPGPAPEPFETEPDPRDPWPTERPYE